MRRQRRFQPILDETIMTENQQEGPGSSTPMTEPDSSNSMWRPAPDPNTDGRSIGVQPEHPDNTTSSSCTKRPWAVLPQLSRRSFLAWVGATSAVTAVTPSEVFALEPAAAPPIVDDGVTRLTVNGVMREANVDVRTSLLDYLRENLQLTGTKKGCDHGQCGACTVHVNGRRVNSCLSLVAMHDGDSVTTIEGLGTPDNMHPMQAAFVEHDGLQCGYCTSGQIMSAVALMKEPCGRSNTDVKEAMSGNICRCGAYSNIVAAIQQVRKA
jgi:xanthine dehydrogenase YagT iron-sulfur-binding subunit